MRARLTERLIATLRTDEKQEDVFHALTPSAGLRVTKDGRKQAGGLKIRASPWCHRGDQSE